MHPPCYVVLNARSSKKKKKRHSHLYFIYNINRFLEPEKKGAPKSSSGELNLQGQQERGRKNQKAWQAWDVYLIIYIVYIIYIIYNQFLLCCLAWFTCDKQKKVLLQVANRTWRSAPQCNQSEQPTNTIFYRHKDSNKSKIWWLQYPWLHIFYEGRVWWLQGQA